MSKVLTFSRVFPSYHPRKGEPTYFVEKMINWWWNSSDHVYHNVIDMILDLNGDKFTEQEVIEFVESLNADVTDIKSHTIRASNRFVAGDYARPVVWYGKPYRSKQLQFLPNILIPKTYEIELTFVCYINSVLISYDQLCDVAGNDGLTVEDFKKWFQFPNLWFKYAKPFDGQIICWNENIKY